MASTAKIILAVGGIFLAGAITGGFVGVRVAQHYAPRPWGGERLGPMEFGARTMEQLHLTPEQKERVRPLLTQMAEELRRVRRESVVQISAALAKMDEALARELTPEQLAKLREIRAREEERRKQWMTERLKRGEGRPGEERPRSGENPPRNRE